MEPFTSSEILTIISFFQVLLLAGKDVEGVGARGQVRFAGGQTIQAAYRQSQSAHFCRGFSLNLLVKILTLLFVQ
jgi:hypothetical protein